MEENFVWRRMLYRNIQVQVMYCVSSCQLYFSSELTCPYVRFVVSCLFLQVPASQSKLIWSTVQTDLCFSSQDVVILRISTKIWRELTRFLFKIQRRWTSINFVFEDAVRNWGMQFYSPSLNFLWSWLSDLEQIFFFFLASPFSFSIFAIFSVRSMWFGRVTWFLSLFPCGVSWSWFMGTTWSLFGLRNYLFDPFFLFGLMFGSIVVWMIF